MSTPIESRNEADANSQHPERPELTELRFLTFTDFNQTIGSETKKQVRSHVQSRLQGERRSAKEKAREKKLRRLVQDVSALSNANAGSSQDPRNSMLGHAVIPRLGGLGAGRSDPFKQYPIEMDVRMHELYDHVHGGYCPLFETLSSVGFFKSIEDEAALRQVLCTSSMHQAKLRHGEESTEAIVLSNEALRSMTRRIADPALAISDGVLFAILAFACHAVMFNDLQGAETHLNGLEEVIRRRGGLQTFRSNPTVRAVLTWIDVNTAFLHDSVPRFPIPECIQSMINAQPLVSPPDRTLLDACITAEMTSAVTELLTLNQFMINELAVRVLWEDGPFAGLHVVPLLSKFLAVRHDISESNPIVAREESCRIGALLYLAGVRQRFGVNLAASNTYIPKLKYAIIAQGVLNLEEPNYLLLWLLVIGGIQSLLHEDHHWFVSAAANLIMHLQCGSWAEVMGIVRQVSWLDGILDIECDEFNTEISSELLTTYGHVFDLVN